MRFRELLARPFRTLPLMIQEELPSDEELDQIEALIAATKARMSEMQQRTEDRMPTATKRKRKPLFDAFKATGAIAVAISDLRDLERKLSGSARSKISNWRLTLEQAQGDIFAIAQ